MPYKGNASDLNNPLEKLIEYVDRNIEISENQLFIKNENKILDYISYNIKNLENSLGFQRSNDNINNIYNYILKMLDEFNKNITLGLYTINQDKSIIEKNNAQSGFIGPEAYYYVSYWWGTRHFFYLTVFLENMHII